MDFDFSQLPSSTVGIVGAVALAVLGLLYRWLRRRDERSEDLERRISETEEALRVALENGMITDAQRLQRRLEGLRKKLERRVVDAEVG